MTTPTTVVAETPLERSVLADDGTATTRSAVSSFTGRVSR
jgi:hypothetical protein